MTERDVLSAVLAQFGIERCGDNSCVFGSPGGMATNGGCRCIPRGEEKIRFVRMAHAMRVLARRVAELGA